MKKTKLTFWIIGFGCGMVTTGMIGALLCLNIKTTETIESTTQIEQEQLKETTLPSLVDEQNEVTSDVNNQEQIEVEKLDESEMEAETVLQETMQEKEVIQEATIKEVIIPSKVTAGEICRILEGAGIIDNADNFLTYIRAKQKQTQLKSGVYQLPINADYEIVLDELIS